jgi:hypothetical protein
MKNMKILLTLFLSVYCVLSSINAQGQENNLEKYNPFSKHEFGFSVGAFPLIGGHSGFLNPKPVGGQKPGHTYHIRDGRNFEKMYHFGSYNLKYNYHFNRKHSIGMSFSWVGKHVDIYWHYPATGGGLFTPNRPAITVEGSGWVHYFTFQGNYRFTYYRKDNVSLFFGVNYGATLYLRDKEILPEKEVTFLLGSVSNARQISAPAFHLTALGIEVGEKNVFNMELGVGTQGILQIGFKHRF